MKAIKRLESLRLKDSYSIVFGLDNKQYTKYADWLVEHDKNCPFADGNNQCAIGSRLTWSFTPTGIGVVCVVRCCCESENDKCDLTNYEDW